MRSVRLGKTDITISDKGFERLELSLKFDARWCHYSGKLLCFTPPVGTWLELYRRPYLSVYYDNKEHSLVRRGFTVCIADRQDVDDSVAVLTIKRVQPASTPFMLRREIIVPVHFDWRCSAAIGTYGLHIPGDTIEVKLDQVELMPTGIHIQDRHKRLWQITDGVGIYISYDTGHWYTPQGHVVKPSTCELGLEMNFEAEVSPVQLSAARAVLSKIAAAYARAFPLSLLRNTKYAEYLSRVSGLYPLTKTRS